MKNITPFLWFDDQAEEAARFYVSLFKDSDVISMTRYGDAGPGPKGTVMTAKFQLDGQEFVALNGGPHVHFTEAISFVVNCETQEEVDEFWEKLRGWRGIAMRLAEGQVRNVLADRADNSDGTATRRECREGATGHESDVANDKDRHRGVKAGA